MRVAFDGRVIADHYPGIGRYAFGLARALAQVADVTLIVNPDAPNSRFDLQAVAARRISVRAGPASLAAQRLVPRALARVGADIFHSPYFLMPFGLFHGPRIRDQASRATHFTDYVLRLTYQALHLTHHLLPTPPITSVPAVATFYDLTPLLPVSGYRAAARLAVTLAHHLAALTAARVIVLSRWARDSFAEALRLKPDRVAVIPPGVGPEFRPRPRAEVEQMRTRLGLPERYVLYVGGQRPHKNLARLVRAHSHLPRHAPPLVLAGPPGSAGGSPHVFAPGRPATGSWAGRRRAPSFGSGPVLCLGPVAEAELPALYSGATLFVLPSLAEGFGLPVLEAMACGTPAACSTAEGLDEAAGDAAARFDPLDIENMTHVLAGLLRDEEGRRQRREAGLDHAAAFTWERAALATLDVYAQALQG